MNDPKDQARTLHGRLSKGLDLILEAKSAGDDGPTWIIGGVLILIGLIILIIFGD